MRPGRSRPPRCGLSDSRPVGALGPRAALQSLRRVAVYLAVSGLFMLINAAAYAYGGVTRLSTPFAYCVTYDMGVVSRVATGACQVRIWRSLKEEDERKTEIRTERKTERKKERKKKREEKKKGACQGRGDLAPPRG